MLDVGGGYCRRHAENNMNMRYHTAAFSSSSWLQFFARVCEARRVSGRRRQTAGTERPFGGQADEPPKIIPWSIFLYVGYQFLREFNTSSSSKRIPHLPSPSPSLLFLLCRLACRTHAPSLASYYIRSTTATNKTLLHCQDDEDYLCPPCPLRVGLSLRSLSIRCVCFIGLVALSSATGGESCCVFVGEGSLRLRRRWRCRSRRALFALVADSFVRVYPKVNDITCVIFLSLLFLSLLILDPIAIGFTHSASYNYFVLQPLWWRPPSRPPTNPRWWRPSPPSPPVSCPPSSPPRPPSPLRAPTNGSALTICVFWPFSSPDTTSSCLCGWDNMARPPRMMMPISSERLTTLEGKLLVWWRPQHGNQFHPTSGVTRVIFCPSEWVMVVVHGSSYAPKPNWNTTPHIISSWKL